MLREKDLESLLLRRFLKEDLRLFFFVSFLPAEVTDFGVFDLFFFVLVVFFVTFSVLFLIGVFETFFFNFFPCDFDRDRDTDLDGDGLKAITCFRIICMAVLFWEMFLFLGACFLES